MKDNLDKQFNRLFIIGLMITLFLMGFSVWVIIKLMQYYGII